MNFQDNQSVCQNQHKTHIKLKTLLEWMTFSRQTNAAKETIHRTQLIPHGQRGTGYIQYFQQEGVLNHIRHFSNEHYGLRYGGRRHLKYRLRICIEALLGFDGLAKGDHSLRPCPRSREESQWRSFPPSKEHFQILDCYKKSVMYFVFEKTVHYTFVRSHDIETLQKEALSNYKD